MKSEAVDVNTVHSQQYCGSNVELETNLMFMTLQQIPGYTAGIDYPNYSEVPKGGSFSCQNRIPGEILLRSKLMDWRKQTKIVFC